jgi:hypothetical protein
MKTNLFVIGQQKAGTSALYDALVECPDVYIPIKKKEFHTLIIPALKEVSKKKLASKGVIDSIESYNSYYNAEGYRYYADFSTSYYYYIDEFIRSIEPNNLRKTKIILILRDDKQRTVSAYKHLYKYGESYAKDCFNKSYNGENSTLLWDEDIFGYTQKKNYVLECLKKRFSSTQLLLIDYSDFRNNPSTIFNQISTFLNVPINISSTKEKNASTYLKSSLLSKILYGQSNFRNTLRKMLPSKLLSLLIELKNHLLIKLSSEPEVSIIDIKKIEKTFSEDNE